MSTDDLAWLAFGAILTVSILSFLLAKRCLRANIVDWGHGWVNLLDGLNRLFCKHYHRMNDVMLDIPDGGPAVVVSNHVSGLDPLLLIAASRRPLRFIIAREQYDRPMLNWLFRQIGCIPVDRENSPEKALRAALRSLREGEVVALFPHGKIHLDSDPPRPLKPGAAILSMKSGAPIVAARIEGVRGQRRIIGAIIARSNVRLTAFPRIAKSSVGIDKYNNRLKRLLEKAP